MISIRYVILSIIYIADYYLLSYSNNSDDTRHAIYNNPHIVLFGTTFIFFYVIKTQDNNKCTKNKLDNKYIISQSIFYSLIALFGHHIYIFLINKQCIEIVNKFIIDISNTSYIPEGLFVSGIVLFSIRLSYLIYPNCDN